MVTGKIPYTLAKQSFLRSNPFANARLFASVAGKPGMIATATQTDFYQQLPDPSDTSREGPRPASPPPAFSHEEPLSASLDDSAPPPALAPPPVLAPSTAPLPPPVLAPLPPLPPTTAPLPPPIQAPSTAPLPPPASHPGEILSSPLLTSESELPPPSTEPTAFPVYSQPPSALATTSKPKPSRLSLSSIPIPQSGKIPSTPPACSSGTGTGHVIKKEKSDIKTRSLSKERSRKISS